MKDPSLINVPDKVHALINYIHTSSTIQYNRSTMDRKSITMMHVLQLAVIITIIYTLTLSLCIATPVHKTSDDHLYLLISFDGFRHDYFEKVRLKVDWIES